MAELSDKGRRLIDAAMAHDEPPPADESWGTLVTRLTEEATQASPIADPPIAEHPSDSVQARGRGRSWIAIAIIAAAVVAGWMVWRSSRDPAVAPDPAAGASAPAKAAPPAKGPTRQPQDARADDPPLERLLVDAQAALDAGDPDRAMTLLERHAVRAAIHEQAPRRMALRVLVLCAQDRHENARDEAKAFLAAHGDSTWGDMVRSSCAADVPH